MEGMVEISVARSTRGRGGEERVEHYEVPLEKGATVMGALQYIYEHYDSTLAFRYSCRNESCGLCAVEVNGRPRLACVTPLKKGQHIRPLQKLPVARDLIVDRQWIMPFLARFDLFAGSDGVTDWPDRLSIPEAYSRLADCTECLSCLAACPSFEFGRDNLGGPFHFVKLAQLHWHPRNTVDRRSQAATLDVARCAACRKCACPIGIPIYRLAIAPLAATGAAAPVAAGFTPARGVGGAAPGG